MGDTLSQTIQLANECKAKAVQLQQIQRAQDFQGPDQASLGAQETELRQKVAALATAAVGTALADGSQAAAQLTKAIANIKTVTLAIGDIQKALTLSADLIALATGVIGANPGSIVSAADQLIKDATAPAAPPPTSGGGSG